MSQSQERIASLNAAIASASNWLYDAGFDALTDEQCALLNDLTRNQKANLLDELQTRHEIPAHLIARIREFLS